MSSSTRLKGQVKKILWITLAWTVISVLVTLYDEGIMMYFSGGSGFNIKVNIYASVISAFFGSIVGGGYIVFWLEKWLRSKPYWWVLSTLTLIYSVVFFIAILISSFIYSSIVLHLPVYHPDVWAGVSKNLMSYMFVKNYLLWYLVTLLTAITLEVNDKYGPGVFRDFLLGKYFHPKREERIFMFLDLRSSTTIAEELGEVQYFNFIKTTFADATPAILYSKGEIYQYVGDEIIVSWKMEPGLDNANCINCFFEIQKYLSEKAMVYKNKYGLVPEFKSGLHYGFVMAGEMGIVKRDIVFSGDVLNTTARIQSMCNELGVNILLSEYLLKKLGDLPGHFSIKKMGAIDLKGKQEKVILYSVQNQLP